VLLPLDKSETGIFFSSIISRRSLVKPSNHIRITFAHYKFYLTRGFIVLNQTQRTPPSEPDTISDGQEMSGFLCIPNVHYRAHNSPLVSPTPKHLNPVQTSHPISLRLILILSSHLRSAPGDPFTCSFLTKILYAFIISLCVGVRSPAEAKDFSCSLSVQTSSEVHPPPAQWVPGVLSRG
jgi:hypothetical protein